MFVNDDCSVAPAISDVMNFESFGLRNVYGLMQSFPSKANGDADFALGFMDAVTGCYRVLFLVVTDSSATNYTTVTALSDPVCVVNVDIVNVVTQPSKVRQSLPRPLSSWMLMHMCMCVCLCMLEAGCLCRCRCRCRCRCGQLC